jgi:hypothetical protein
MAQRHGERPSANLAFTQTSTSSCLVPPRQSGQSAPDAQHSAQWFRHTSGGLFSRESDLWDRDVLIDPAVLALERVQLGPVVTKRVCLEVAQRHGPSTYRTRGLLQSGFWRLGRKRNHWRLPRLPRYRRIGMLVRVCSQRKRVLLCGKSLRQRNIGPPLWTSSNRDHGVQQRRPAYRPRRFTRGRDRPFQNETTHTPNVLRPRSWRPTRDRHGAQL